VDDEDESDIEYDRSGGYNPWHALSDHIVSAAPIAPSTLESTPSTMEAAGAVDALVHTAPGPPVSQTTTTATTDATGPWTAMTRDESFSSISESVVLGATQNRRDRAKGCRKGQFPKGVGKLRCWAEFVAKQAADLKEQQDAALEAHHATALKETLRIAATASSLPPVATGMSVSISAENQGMATADEEMQAYLRDEEDDDRQARGEEGRVRSVICQKLTHLEP
jgi:hypothetical protein